jgi:hypothetical protein
MGGFTSNGCVFFDPPEISYKPANPRERRTGLNQR